MEKSERVEVHYVEEEAKWPSGLTKASEVSEILGISVSRIKELADAHYLPHWRINGGEPLFKPAEVKRWAAKNMLQRIDGQDLPIELKVLVDPPEAKGAPEQLQVMPNLRELPIPNAPPGVYFLVKDGEVVYIGQSVNPLARIAQHTDKEFTHAYMIPVPSTMLDSVEGALIRAMNPKLNSGKIKKAYGPGDKKDDPFILQRFANIPPVHLINKNPEEAA